jgi:enamine deaminase RidA (YjgF/YER057c/UK114 family)
MSKRYINPKTVWSDPEFPFSQAVVEPEGRRVHLTGQVGWDKNSNIVGVGDAKLQTECAIDNIKKILSEIGGSLSDVMSVTMYYVRDEDLPDIQEVRSRRFPKSHGPAATGVKVAGLVHPDLLVELTTVAVIPKQS